MGKDGNLVKEFEVFQVSEVEFTKKINFLLLKEKDR